MDKATPKDVFQAQGHYTPVNSIHLPGYKVYTEGHTGQIRRRQRRKQRDGAGGQREPDRVDEGEEDLDLLHDRHAVEAVGVQYGIGLAAVERLHRRVEDGRAPAGATECSRGWSAAEPGVAESNQ